MCIEPLSTYRVQFGPGFGFDQGFEIAAYLSALGISHLYASPYLQAAIGSTHGYDIVDPTHVNDSLGGSEAHMRMCQSLKFHGLGHIIDVVPNHMAIVDHQNPWWWDILKNGPSSWYAAYFDVDWYSSEERWPNKVLLPVLEEQYGCALEKKMLQLSHDKGLLTLHYKDHVFPIDASSLVDVLTNAAKSSASEALLFLAESHARLPKPTVTARQSIERRHRDKAVLLEFLQRLCSEEPLIDAAISAEVDRLNLDQDALHALLEKQNYRLAHWRTANKDLGYRRFFDVKDLIGLRIEEDEVFNATHALPIEWVQGGLVQGLRIDHPDGLREPTQYFARLREKCPEAWIVAEKILAADESLPREWPIAGTTGYDFLNRVGRLFIDPEAEERLTKIYTDFTNAQSDYMQIVYECKKLVLTELLVSELNQLANIFVEVCEKHPRYRDYSLQELKEALLETAVHFPVYRSYVSSKAPPSRQDDAHYIASAIEKAMASKPDLEEKLFKFLMDLLLLHVPGTLEEELALRFQQLTSPTMAKGVEDTAFYRFNRFIALNEVGGDPSQFSISVREFHAACTKSQLERPFSLLASTTHDSKRSEDVRVRLSLLSEIPDLWEAAVVRWSQQNARYKQEPHIDRSMEYFLYQTLVGAWPISLERLMVSMQKSLREAKVCTSWIKPNQPYEHAWGRFLEGIMRDEDFCADMTNFVSHLSSFGQINSLAQTLIKLTAPGIPDFYQGTELWAFSLVDPDNRQAVDFGKLQRYLNEMSQLTIDQIFNRSDEGFPKLWLIRQALYLRNRMPENFGQNGTYTPLYAVGPKSQHVVSYARGNGVVVVVPRLSMQLSGAWENTHLEIPTATWHNVLTDENVSGGEIYLRDLFNRFPVALLAKEM